MQFLDEAKIYVFSGKGGDGCLSFRRERNIPFGGPDGGNGGKGGSVIAVATNNLNTLIDYRFNQHFKAGKGQHGMGSNMYGKNGDDVIMKLPVGTEIWNWETEELIADITEEGQEIIICEGGNGGRGNLSFASSTNRAPRQFGKGQPATEMTLQLRLKLLADVGLVGFPNAGKSTFISRVSNAKPKVADYPFTTLHPALGMVRHYGTDMVMADLPGLIEGAAEGRGLGHQFLKHVARCRAILHLIDPTEGDPVEKYQTIRKELEEYDDYFDESVSQLPEVLAFSKSDAIGDDEFSEELVADFTEQTGVKPHVFSSASGAGLDAVLNELRDVYLQYQLAEEESSESTEKLSSCNPLEDDSESSGNTLS